MPRSLWVFRVPRDDPNNTQFVLGELFNHGNLRQGWGIPNLDLTLPDHVWIQNYINGCLQYWNHIATPNEATERRNILLSMLYMRVNDVIFIPNVSQNQIDENNFTIVTVSGPYQFQNMANQPIQDFGHMVFVTRLQGYQFSNHTLPRSIFGAPFMRCVDQIQPHWRSYQSFDTFLTAINY